MDAEQIRANRQQEKENTRRKEAWAQSVDAFKDEL